MIQPIGLDVWRSPDVLDLRGVTFRRHDRDVIAGIDLNVGRGEHWAVLGPNGAGKSTVLGFCGAVSFPTTGTVHVLGHQLGRVELQALRRHIGHVNPRHAPAQSMTVAEVLLSGRTGTTNLPPRWVPTATELKLAEAQADALGLSSKLDRQWMHMSQGERGRALIGRALVAEPQLLLLDEPTTGLDIAAREQLLSTISAVAQRQPEVTTVLVTHHVEELPTSTTHALLIAKGKSVASGPIGDVLTSEAVSIVFDHPITIEHRAGRWTARAAAASLG